MSTTAPETRIKAKPTKRDQQYTLAPFASLTPERISTILSEAERGRVRDWADLCTKMRTADTHINADYVTRISAVAGARWVVEPGQSSSPLANSKAQEAAEFVERVLKQIPDFHDVCINLLDAVFVGFSASEIIWHYDVAGMAWVPRQIAWVHPRRFRFGDAYELRLMDEGDDVYDSVGKPLDSRKWMVHRPKLTADYTTLAGCARPVAWAYCFKRWGVTWWLNTVERLGAPLITASVPQGASAAVRAEALRGLEDLSADHVAVLEDPTAIQILQTGIRDGGSHAALVDAMNREISKAILGMTDTTEPGAVGSYAAVESRKGSTIDARKSLDERSLASTFERDLFKPLLELNAHLFGGVVPAIPRIRWVLANESKEIPQHVVGLGVVTRNELRASLDLEPLAGPEGDEFVTQPQPALGGSAPLPFPQSRSNSPAIPVTSNPKAKASGPTMLLSTPTVELARRLLSADQANSSSKPSSTLRQSLPSSSSKSPAKSHKPKR